jgi:uncharacterized protein
MAAAAAGPIRRLLDWGLLSHLEAIDREYVKPGSTTDGRVLTVVYTSCLLLFALNYVVLTQSYQLWMSRILVEHLGLWGASGAEAFEALSRDQLSLTMRISWTLGCSFFYLLIPGLIQVFVLKRPLGGLGINPRGFFRHLWIYAILFLPVAACVWIVSFQESFQQTYPFYHHPSSFENLLCWELFYGLQFFSLEFFFRGFMLTELKHKWGWRAVLFMMTPYCMIHFSKPGLEALGAIIAGSVLGILALRTRNIWGGVAIHVAVAWSMDIASLLQRGWFDGPHAL